MYSGGERQSQAILKFSESDKTTHPIFPGHGVLVLGQEQERICGGFDDYDSLSADISEFQVCLLSSLKVKVQKRPFKNWVFKQKVNIVFVSLII